MSPFELGILIHYYGCCDEAEEVRRQPPILAETMEWFLKEDLLKPATHKHGGSYECTERGKWMVEYICALPIPRQIFIMPEKWRPHEADK